MSVLLEVQEALYQRFDDRWKVQPGEDITPWAEIAAALFGAEFVLPAVGEPRTQFVFGDEKMTPPNSVWARFSVKSMPGDQGTLGPVGARRFDRAGRIFLQLFHPPGGGEAILSPLGEYGRDIFEGCRFGPHDIRFNVVDVGDSAIVEDGRWASVLVEGRFDYEEQK